MEYCNSLQVNAFYRGAVHLVYMVMIIADVRLDCVSIYELSEGRLLVIYNLMFLEWANKYVADEQFVPIWAIALLGQYCPD